MTCGGGKTKLTILTIQFVDDLIQVASRGNPCPFQPCLNYPNVTVEEFKRQKMTEQVSFSLLQLQVRDRAVGKDGAGLKWHIHTSPQPR